LSHETSTETHRPSCTASLETRNNIGIVAAALRRNGSNREFSWVAGQASTPRVVVSQDELLVESWGPRRGASELGTNE
ncbi:hypothetical protein HAX54_011527, partial [Datura stramonium]|nr:hypothetical protein [Datura stramonium]